MAHYRLRSGLSKTAVYTILKDHLPESIKLLPLRKCGFRKYRASYWLDFTSDTFEGYYEIYFFAWAGYVRFKVDRYEYSQQIDRYLTSTEVTGYVPFQYLQERGYLREVA